MDSSSPGVGVIGPPIFSRANYIASWLVRWLASRGNTSAIYKASISHGVVCAFFCVWCRNRQVSFTLVPALDIRKSGRELIDNELDFYIFTRSNKIYGFFF